MILSSLKYIQNFFVFFLLSYLVYSSWTNLLWGQHIVCLTSSCCSQIKFHGFPWQTIEWMKAGFHWLFFSTIDPTLKVTVQACYLASLASLHRKQCAATYEESSVSVKEDAINVSIVSPYQKVCCHEWLYAVQQYSWQMVILTIYPINSLFNIRL